MIRLIKPMGNRGFAAGTALIVAVAAVVLVLMIVFRAINHSRNTVNVIRLSRAQAEADGDLQYGLARLHKRISENLENRIINGINNEFIDETDLQRYDQQNPALFWTEWMNNIPDEPDFTVVDSSVAAYTITDSSTNITVRLIYANGQLTSGGFANALWNDFTLRYYYEIVCVNKNGIQTSARSFFFGDNDRDNSIQIRLWRSLSTYNLWTEFCTLPDESTPIYDSKSYTGQVYSGHCFYADGTPIYGKTVHISQKADPNYYEHRTNAAFEFLDANGVSMYDSDHTIIPATQNMDEETQRRIAYYGYNPGVAIPGGLTPNAVYGATETLQMADSSVAISSTCLYVNGDAYINISCPDEETTTYYRIESPVGTLKYTATQYTAMLKDPHMLIFVDGNLRIDGDLTAGSKTTIAAKDNICITNNLRYAGPTDPWPTTVLGLVTWQGHILFANNIAGAGIGFSIEVDAVFMSLQGGIGIEGWENIPNTLPFLGTITHKGCTIRKYCLPTISADYQRGWAYTSSFDLYLETQKAPPYFPGNGRYKLDTDKLTVVDIYSRN